MVVGCHDPSLLRWWVEILILFVATLIIVGAKIVGIELPDTMIRVLGIAELITLPIFVFASVKNFLTCYIYIIEDYLYTENKYHKRKRSKKETVPPENSFIKE